MEANFSLFLVSQDQASPLKPPGINNLTKFIASHADGISGNSIRSEVSTLWTLAKSSVSAFFPPSGLTAGFARGRTHPVSGSRGPRGYVSSVAEPAPLSSLAFRGVLQILSQDLRYVP